MPVCVSATEPGSRDEQATAPAQLPSSTAAEEVTGSLIGVRKATEDRRLLLRRAKEFQHRSDLAARANVAASIAAGALQERDSDGRIALWPTSDTFVPLWALDIHQSHTDQWLAGGAVFCCRRWSVCIDQRKHRLQRQCTPNQITVAAIWLCLCA